MEDDGVMPRTRSAGADVTDAILEFMRKARYESGEKITPREFNMGKCIDLAEYVDDKGIDGVEIVSLVDALFPGASDDEIDDADEKYPRHDLIKFEGKFFDSEVPRGVSSIEDVPILKRFRKYEKRTKD